MEIIEKADEKEVLRIVVDTNEQSLFSLLQTYLNELEDVELAGIYREHHLVEKTEFFLKVKKGSALSVFKKALKDVKKDLENKKLK